MQTKRIRRSLLLLPLFLFSLSACYTYKIFPKAARVFSYEGHIQKAYILNPELKREYKILVQSNIFELSGDSLDKDIVRIKLYPIRRHLVCGQPIVLSAFTLGQFPVYLPDTYQYQFDEISADNSISKKSIELNVATRYWFWDMFSFNKNFKGKAGKVLCYRYHQNGIVQQ